MHRQARFEQHLPIRAQSAQLHTRGEGLDPGVKGFACVVERKRNCTELRILLHNLFLASPTAGGRRPAPEQLQGVLSAPSPSLRPRSRPQSMDRRSSTATMPFLELGWWRATWVAQMTVGSTLMRGWRWRLQALAADHSYHKVDPPQAGGPGAAATRSQVSHPHITHLVPT